VGEASIYVRHGSDGPAVLLLHGHPRTSATWYRVAPQLMQHGFMVVCPDLRGYGRSQGPAATSDHTAHSIQPCGSGRHGEIIGSLGHRRFGLAGTRGSYVAFRLALDYPDAVSRLALLDCIPISDHLFRITPEFATRWWHWSSSPSRGPRNGLSTPVWTAGTGATPKPWAKRTTTSGGRDPQSRRGSRDAGVLPGRPDCRPTTRRGRSGRRAPPTDAGAGVVVAARRPGGLLW
jgi:pimeloyl-ACP methyl ester carboxylesterase